MYDSSASTSASWTNSVASAKQQRSRHADQSHLRPEDAFYVQSPPRKRNSDSVNGSLSGSTANFTSDSRKWRDKRHAGPSGSRRRRSGKDGSGAGAKAPWKKLLWVKQSYPDNYTDEDTFLDQIQRNPRLRPYEFWPLVADSTIIVQHVCSVIIFVCCFRAIFQARVSPQTVVGWATTGTVAGWVLRDYWQSREEAELAAKQKAREDGDFAIGGDDSEKVSQRSSLETTADFGMPFKESHTPLATSSMNGTLSQPHSRIPSINSVDSAISHITTPISASSEINPAIASLLHPSSPVDVFPWNGEPSTFSQRMQERLMTAKSAILIYCSLLGLSPILKSLTKSTSSDSIWALSSWLMILNVFTFDYGAGPESKFPASLSTNAAVMASTVLASRLPTTTHVFSLTLFSIEVFGLFPVFRRHLRHHSWNGHLWLTTFLVILASGGLSMTISGGGYIMGMVGVVLGGIICCLSMGLTSWWLIGLQRYKNEIHGPWDPARPVLRGVWN